MPIRHKILRLNARHTVSILFVLLLALILPGCLNSLFESSTDDYRARTHRVELLEINGNKVTLSTHSIMPDPCHSYSRHTVERLGDENIWLVTLYIRSNQQYCVTILGSLERTIELTLPGPKMHTIQFWKSGKRNHRHYH
jgi:hypothetical protein